MRYAQKRTLVILVVLVALLAAALLAVKAYNRRSAQKKADDAATSAAGAVTSQSTGYKALTYNNGSATLSFAKGEDGTWAWSDDKDFPLDNDQITAILETISGLMPQQTITQGDTLEAYGLDSPAMTLTATADDGTETTFALGNATSDGQSYYLLLNGQSSPVYIIDGALHTELAKGIYDMMRLPALPQPAEKDISAITVSGAAQTDLTASLETDAGASASASASASAAPAVTVDWRSQGANVTDNQDVTALVSEVRALSLAACQDYKPSDKAAALCGFDKPACVLRMDYTDADGKAQTLELTVANTTAAGDGRYVRIKDDSTIYSIAAEKLTTLLSVAEKGLSA
jgi:type II secretory pathway pseudopilin PulG